MYPAAITWKANSGGIKDNPDSKGSMPGVDELFKSRIVFDNIKSLKKNLNLNGMGMLYTDTCITAVSPMLRYTFCIDEHQTFMADSPYAALAETVWIKKKFAKFERFGISVLSGVGAVLSDY